MSLGSYLALSLFRVQWGGGVWWQMFNNQFCKTNKQQQKRWRWRKFWFGAFSNFHGPLQATNLTSGHWTWSWEEMYNNTGSPKTSHASSSTPLTCFNVQVPAEKLTRFHFATLPSSKWIMGLCEPWKLVIFIKSPHSTEKSPRSAA